MKKVIIIPSNTDLNRGDQALVWESIRLVEDIYHKDVESILMGDLDSEYAEMQNRQTNRLGYKMIDTVLKHPGRCFRNKTEDSKSYSKFTLIQWGVQAIVDYCRTRLVLSSFTLIRKLGMLLLNNSQKATVKKIEECDSVFVKGGGFIHSYGAITDPYFIYFLTYHIRLAEAFEKKIIVLPNSIGPLKNKHARNIAISTLKRCSLLTVRENLSKQCLQKYNVNSYLYPDLGFFLKPTEKDMTDYLNRIGVPSNKKKVVITLRPYRFQGFSNPNKLFANYIDGIKELVNHLVGKNYHVTFMAHTLGPSSHENDSIAIEEVMRNLDKFAIKNSTFIQDLELNCRDVEEIYSHYDYMIGTRFHSVIFALNVQVPSIAIAYGGNKGKGIMNVLGNDNYSIDMDKVDKTSLIHMFDELESQRNNYLSNLSQKRILIEEERKKLVSKIREVLSID